MIDPSLIAPERVRPLRRSEYERLVELGDLADERLELLQGVLVEMPPQGSVHAEVVTRLHTQLTIALAGRAVVRVQVPFAATDDSEPEPDIAVVPKGDYVRAHPSTAMLVIEVAESSRRRDQELKARIYAAAGVPEYWVVDLVGRAVEVRTTPGPDGYRQLATHTSGSLHASAFPDVEIPVSLLLP